MLVDISPSIQLQLNWCMHAPHTLQLVLQHGACNFSETAYVVPLFDEVLLTTHVVDVHCVTFSSDIFSLSLCLFVMAAILLALAFPLLSFVRRSKALSLEIFSKMNSNLSSLLFTLPADGILTLSNTTVAVLSFLATNSPVGNTKPKKHCSNEYGMHMAAMYIYFNLYFFMYIQYLLPKEIHVEEQVHFLLYITNNYYNDTNLKKIII